MCRNKAVEVLGKSRIGADVDGERKSEAMTNQPDIIGSPWFKKLSRRDQKIFKNYVCGSRYDISPADLWRMLDILLKPKQAEQSKYTRCEVRAAGACKCIDRCEPFPEGTGKKSFVSFPLAISDLDGYEVNLIKKV